MKKYILIGLIILSIAISGCGGGGSNNSSPDQQSQKGTVSLKINGGDFSAKTLTPDMGIASYDISGTGPNGAVFSQNDVTPGQTVAINCLALGDWTVTVYGNNAAKARIAAGSTKVTVAVGTVNAGVTVIPLAGTGALQVNLSWPTDSVTSPGVFAKLTPQAGNDIIISFAMGLNQAFNQTASYWNPAIPAGYYTLTIVLKDGQRQVAITNEAVRIATGQTTTGGYLLKPTSYATAIATGYFHSLVVMKSGNIQAWGSNSLYQLGVGPSFSEKLTPVLLGNSIYGVIAVAGGSSHSLALDKDGNVSAWGNNSDGQLGDGSTTNMWYPMPVRNLSGVAGISAGSSFSLAVKKDGSVFAWGFNGTGQLGDGTTTDRLTPQPVTNLSGIRAVAGKVSVSYALKGDGTVWAWGLNTIGQLGDRTIIDRYTPVQVLTASGALSGIIAIGAGNGFGLALKSDGTVWAWGRNDSGQLGNGSLGNKNYAVPVSGLTGVMSIVAGEVHCLALKSDGTVWAWGNNEYGQLGNNSIGTSSNIPVAVQGLPDSSSSYPVAIDAYISNLVLMYDGSVWSWGNNQGGQLGNGSKDDNAHPFPAKVKGY